MAPINSCGSTVYEGSTPAEVPGCVSWEWNEEASVEDYVDNTTDCNEAAMIGPVRRPITIVYNLQDGVAKGKPVWRARDVLDTLQLHIDDTGSNYWEFASATVLGFSNHKFDLKTGQPIAIEYTLRPTAAPTPNGTLA